MKYKLINNKTKEEHLCDKVTIDGFDYYVSDINPKLFNKYIDDTNTIRSVVTFDKEYWEDRQEYQSIIATTNPNIDIPKVVDEIEKIADEWFLINGYNQFDYIHSHRIPDAITTNKLFKTGYNKSQETHPFSLDDVKEIINLAREQYWDVDNRGFSSNTEGDWSFKYSTEDEIIQKYQETKVLTIYYKF